MYLDYEVSGKILSRCFKPHHPSFALSFLSLGLTHQTVKLRSLFELFHHFALPLFQESITFYFGFQKLAV